jgi:hypothetical protein
MRNVELISASIPRGQPACFSAVMSCPLEIGYSAMVIIDLSALHTDGQVSPYHGIESGCPLLRVRQYS